MRAMFGPINTDRNMQQAVAVDQTLVSVHSAQEIPRASSTPAMIVEAGNS